LNVIFAWLDDTVERYNDAIAAGAAVVIAIFTFTLWRATTQLWRAADRQIDVAKTAAGAARNSASAALRQADTLTSAERAYVKMSPKGDFEPAGAGRIKLTIEVKNFGRTPAYVTDLIVNVMQRDVGAPLPDLPNYQSDENRARVSAFLVTNEPFFNHTVFEDDGAITGARNGTRAVWIEGYVDYVDIFGQRHRGGFARAVDRSAEGFVFIASMAYNYDRTRETGEGNDWDL